jgi:hypothetical protein
MIHFFTSGSVISPEFIYLQQHCKKLKLKRNYRPLAAAFLLALYAFMATPVSFWHHHQNNTRKQHTEQNVAAGEENTVVGITCKICSHHYSVAANDAVTVYFAPVTFFNFFSDCYLLTHPTCPHYCQYNKGPPASA